MLTSGDTLDLGPLNTIFHIRKTGADTAGRSFEMEWELGPHTGGTPVHVHPQAEEAYEVLAGELELFVDGAWRTLHEGDRLIVPPGKPHTFRNASDAPARVYNTHAPAMDFEGYFERLHRLVAGGAFASGRVTLRGMLHLAVLMTEHRAEIRSVRPPDAVMRLFGRVGRWLGYRVD